MSKSIHRTTSDKVIHVKGKMARPIRQKDGSWKVVEEDYEEDIPDLGREELICNNCGWPTYPECKNTFCKAWVRHTSSGESK